MMKFYVKFKGGSWVESCYKGDFEDYILRCFEIGKKCKFLLVFEGEDWKYKWMEQDDLNG